ncbi:MAG: ABC transporter ATP-binding protein [bacterium]|nr:ABC transporter ATP-binding protein [bacterium]
MFELKNVSKTYNGKEVLSINHMKIESGKICCVSGPNGSGKSTFLEILAGLIPATSGEVLFNGRPVMQTGKSKIIMVLQDPVMFDTSVYGNLAFSLKVKGVPSKDHDRLITETLELVNLEQYKKRNANRLSGGEKQRVAIARALVTNPDVLIMDEPTSGLDIPARNSLVDIIKKIHALKHITCIIAGHDKEFLLALATTAFTLIRGQYAPISVDNLFHGTVLDEDTIQIQENLCFHVPTHREGKVNLVIAPENIVLSTEAVESSMRNRFEGHVTRMEKDGDHVNVIMDIGVELCSRITPQSLRKMGISIGHDLWLEFKATAVKVY